MPAAAAGLAQCLSSLGGWHQVPGWSLTRPTCKQAVAGAAVRPLRGKLINRRWHTFVRLVGLYHVRAGASFLPSFLAATAAQPAICRPTSVYSMSERTRHFSAIAVVVFFYSSHPSHILPYVKIRVSFSKIKYVSYVQNNNCDVHVLT